MWLYVRPTATLRAFDTDLSERKTHTQEQYHAKHPSYPSVTVRHQVFSLWSVVLVAMMMSHVAMRVPLVSPMIAAALKMSVAPPAHNPGEEGAGRLL